MILIHLHIYFVEAIWMNYLMSIAYVIFLKAIEVPPPFFKEIECVDFDAKCK